MSDFDTENKTLSILGFIVSLVAFAAVIVEVILANTGAAIPGPLPLILVIAGLVLGIVGIIITVLALAHKVGSKVLSVIGLILAILAFLMAFALLAMCVGLVFGIVGVALLAAA